MDKRFNMLGEKKSDESKKGDILQSIRDYVCDEKNRKYVFMVPLLIVLLIIGVVKNSLDSKPVEIDINPGTQLENLQIVESFIYIDISGEIKVPGVYKVTEGTRLFQVIDMAGGLTEKADINSLNRAEIVYDGQKVQITKVLSEGETDEGSISTQSGGSYNGKISINNSSSAQLQTLPGIGEVKAQRIVDYRTANGRFKKLEDLMNVTGIGINTFNNLKAYIVL